MKYLLDTNLCIRIINGCSLNARMKLTAVSPADIVVCSVVRAELFYGSAKSQTPEASRRKQNLFLAPFATLAFDDAIAVIYGEIRANLEKQGTQIGSNDLLIAATALAHNLILVTHNLGEFSRVPNLQIEDWEI